MSFPQEFYSHYSIPLPVALRNVIYNEGNRSAEPSNVAGEDEHVMGFNASIGVDSLGTDGTDAF